MRRDKDVWNRGFTEIQDDTLCVATLGPAVGGVQRDRCGRRKRNRVISGNGGSLAKRRGKRSSGD